MNVRMFHANRPVTFVAVNFSPPSQFRSTPGNGIATRLSHFRSFGHSVDPATPVTVSAQPHRKGTDARPGLGQKELAWDVSNRVRKRSNRFARIWDRIAPDAPIPGTHGQRYAESTAPL